MPTYYVKTYASREEAMVEKRDNGTVIYYRDGSGETADIVSFDTEPQTGFTEDATFDPIVAVRIEEDPKWAKIYRYIKVAQTDFDEAPVDIDYRTGLSGADSTLYPVREFFAGELNRVAYYSDEAKTDLILEVVVVYDRDPLGFASRRTTTRRWFCEDGTECLPNKVTVKLYDDPLKQLTEGIRRRGNLIRIMTGTTLGMMIATVAAKDGEDELSRQGRLVVEGRDFMAIYKKEFNNFIDDSNKDIITKISRAQAYWLDNIIDAHGTTIRDYLVTELNKV